jgi:site-specific recombinase XerC
MPKRDLYKVLGVPSTKCWGSERSAAQRDQASISRTAFTAHPDVGEYPEQSDFRQAVRMLFDWLVVGQVLAVNPAAPVRGPKHVVKVGKTPVLGAAEARELLDSINTNIVVGLRDHALIALLTFTFARISAALRMNVEDVYWQHRRLWVRLHEKRQQATLHALLSSS